MNIDELTREVERLKSQSVPAFYQNVIKTVIVKTGIADNVSTPVFTITTTNESGNTDGGGYVCRVEGLVGHAAISAADFTAIKGWSGQFSRAMIAAGTGVNTAVENIFSGASAATTGATRDIGTITMAVAETSEYVQTVSFTIDLSGTSVSTAEVVLRVELEWTGFLTAPAIAAA